MQLFATDNLVFYCKSLNDQRWKSLIESELEIKLDKDGKISKEKLQEKFSESLVEDIFLLAKKKRSFNYLLESLCERHIDFVAKRLNIRPSGRKNQVLFEILLTRIDDPELGRCFAVNRVKEMRVDETTEEIQFNVRWKDLYRSDWISFSVAQRLTTKVEQLLAKSIKKSKSKLCLDKIAK